MLVQLRSTASVLVVAAAAYGLAAVAPAAPAAPVRAPRTAPVATSTATNPVVEASALPARALAEPGALTPLSGDFNGDGETDVLMYGPGSRPDHLWLGRAGGTFSGVRLLISGTYEPVVGDFDGDRKADVLWYAPGGGTDVVWYGGTGGRFVRREVSVSGAYEALTGDFDGDGKGDVFWYGAGTTRDVVWYGTGSRSFVSRSVTVNRSYRPVLGDFDGDKHTDVLWYGSGSAKDALWYSGGRGVFRGVAINVSGTYEPVVGDFDGNTARDVLWYGAGSAPDAAWYGTRSRRFVGRSTAIGAAGVPVPRDFDGDGRGDLLVYGPGAAADYVYYGRTSGGFDRKAVSLPHTTYHPVGGDFGGDGRDDVFFYAPGNAMDSIWSGYGRGFIGRNTTIDIGFERAIPLRPESIRNQFNPYGFVAHAMGGIDGHGYTNTLEAFQYNYDRGYRVFEADQVVLADGTVVVAHDGTEASYGLNKLFKDSTWADLEGHKFQGKYTILRAQDLVALMKQYTDAYIILDLKYEGVRAWTTYVRLAGRDPAIVERLMPHVADPAMLAAMRKAYPLQNYVVALYRTQAYGRMDNPELLDWVRKERVPAVMMWFGTRNRAISLAANNRERRRFESSFVADIKALGAVPYVHTVNDKAVAQSFWDRRIGLYSDVLFPPFSATASSSSVVAPSGMTPDE
ncbi:MAG TPA: FG-GAP-like repeat-containing protein [Frankiaceae bacterium]|nr:FG-GAP-like repeat-containing protein [Frankiaceae bacterium]